MLGDYTERLLVKQKEGLEAKVEEEYRNQCFSSPFKEKFKLTYAKKEYHYTLYYYDQAGNLVQTVPPEGVVLDGTGQNHKLQTKYAYNTLGQVVWQETPDAGESKFWIDYYGRVKLSQNAEQKEHSDYAYSKFDQLGRPYEVGKVYISLVDLDAQTDIKELIFDSNFPIAKQDAVVTRADGTLTNPVVDFKLSERTKTFYDKHDATGIVDPNEQKNLKNRVAAVVVIEAEKTDESQADVLGAITRYSYDIHGNVEKLWQKMPQETGLPEKTVEYNYDLLSGKVNEVIYNRGGDKDEFRHRYLYDGDNRLTQVETSLDGYHWTLEASYFYYAHGPLARIETGLHNLQGTDYFYTLQGWIKGVNSIGLDADRDLGQDGAQQSTFNKDEYAYALNYYEGDYEARGGTDLLGETFYTNEKYSLFTGYQDKVERVTYNRESLYNGNIAAMATSIRNLGEEHATQSMNYRYDQLHRIAAAHATKWYEGTWTTTVGSYNTSYDYDKNGNIQSLYRNDRDAVTIDDLSYRYDPIKKNRLDLVRDGGTAEGLNNANPYEYNYDNIGNLIKNEEDGIKDIEWNIYGKVTKVTKTPDQFGIQATIDYRYDGTGNRIMKKVTAGATRTTTTYLRDASGNVMAIYEEKTDQTLAIKEIPIYGSSRLGQYRPKTDTKKTALGQRIYEFSNHLGNVLVTLTDNKVPQTDGTYESVVLSASDYYPFGMAMAERTYSNSEYRYGFNGKENDTDFGNDQLIQDYGFRLYAPSVVRFFSVDPLSPSYPWYTPYQFAGNKPIWCTDLDGLEEVVYWITSPHVSGKVEKLLDAYDIINRYDNVSEAIRKAEYWSTNPYENNESADFALRMNFINDMNQAVAQKVIKGDLKNAKSVTYTFMLTKIKEDGTVYARRMDVTYSKKGFFERIFHKGDMYIASINGPDPETGGMRKEQKAVIAAFSLATGIGSLVYSGIAVAGMTAAEASTWGGVYVNISFLTDVASVTLTLDDIFMGNIFANNLSKKDQETFNDFKAIYTGLTLIKGTKDGFSNAQLKQWNQLTVDIANFLNGAYAEADYFMNSNSTNSNENEERNKKGN